MLSPDDEMLSFDQAKYQAQVHEELVKEHTIIFALAFSPDGRYLVAGSCFGRIVVWDIVAALSGDAARSAHGRRPLAGFQACRDAVYCLRFVRDMLVCGTNQDVRGYRWQEILGATQNAHDVRPLFVQRAPTANAYIGGVEINGIAERDNILYGACGDSQVYAWDLGSMQTVRTYDGHTDYVHCVEVRPCGQLVSGSEDGTVRLWDTKTGACLNTLEAPMARKERKLAEHSSKGKSSKKSSSRASDSKSKSRKEGGGETAAPWIPCIAIDSTDNWLATGGLSSPVVWHIPSLTPAVQPKSRGQTVVRDIIFADDEILTVGDNAHLCRWSMGGELKAQTPASSSSNYAVCVNTAGPKVIAMSGVGAQVDIFINPRYKAFSLEIF